MKQEKFDSENRPYPATDDPLTSKEKKFRDNLFERLYVTRILSFGNAANLVTVFGYCLAFFAIYDFFATRSLLRQFFILGLSWLTDLIDGPVARKNNNVTLLGTVLDHSRDSILVAWMVFVVFFSYRTIPSEFLIFPYLIMTASFVFIVILGANIRKFRVFRKKKPPQLSEILFLKWFWNEKMATMAIGRFAFASFAVSIIIFFLSLGVPSIAQTAFKTGVCVFAFHLVFLGAYLYETLLEPHEKIKNQEKIIEKLVNLRKKWKK